MESSDVKITITFDNHGNCSDLHSLWGFSCLVQIAGKNLLFDTGSNGRVLLKNMQKKSLDIENIDSVFISHGHWDHMGGLDSVLELNPNMDIYVTSYISDVHIDDLKMLTKGVVSIIEDKPQKILPYVYSTGTIGEDDEQSLIIDTDDGLIVITGCAHSGGNVVANVAKQALDKDILLLLGGFHLLSEDEETINTVVTDIKSLGTKYVCPSHCTGNKGIAIFADDFKDAYVQGGLGAVIGFRAGKVSMTQ